MEVWKLEYATRELAYTTQSTSGTPDTTFLFSVLLGVTFLCDDIWGTSKVQEQTQSMRTTQSQAKVWWRNFQGP